MPVATSEDVEAKRAEVSALNDQLFEARREAATSAQTRQADADMKALLAEEARVRSELAALKVEPIAFVPPAPDGQSAEGAPLEVTPTSDGAAVPESTLQGA